MPEAQQPAPGGRTGGQGRILAALGVLYLVWGSTYLATKVMVTHEPPLLAAGLRFLLAGSLLGAYAWWRGDPPRLDRAELCRIATVAALSILFSNGCNVLAAQHLPSNVLALLNATQALFIASLGTCGRRGSPLTAASGLGLAVGLAGVVLVLAPGNAGLAAGGLGWKLVSLLGCLCWALGTVYLRGARISNSPTMFLALQMLAGGTALLGGATLHGESFSVHWTLPGALAFLWLTLASSCLAYSAYLFLAVNTRPAILGTYAYVNPAVAAILGWLVLDEVLRPVQIAGMTVILLGVALVAGYVDWPRLAPARPR